MGPPDRRVWRWLRPRIQGSSWAARLHHLQDPLCFLWIGVPRSWLAGPWALGPAPRREQLQKLRWAWTAARPGLLGVVPPPWEPAHLTLLPASPCRVDSEDRSGQYSCIFLPEHAGRTDLEVKGRLQGEWGQAQIPP